MPTWRAAGARGAPGARLALALLAAVTWGCSNDLEDLIAEAADAGAADAGTDSELTVEGLMALYGGLVEGTACTDCMMQRCASLAERCLQDPTCRQQAWCEAKCRDPACILECPQGALGTGRADWARIYEDPTPDQCRATQCFDACDGGRQLGCVGKFGWDRPLRTGGSVEVIAISAGTDTTVAACGGALPECSGEAVAMEPLPGFEPTVVNDMRIEVGTQVLEVLAPGYFELRAQGADTNLWYPMFDPSAAMPLILLNLLRRDVIEGGGPVFREPATDGFLVLYPTDCLLDFASRVVFSVEPAAEDSEPWYGLYGSGDECEAGGLGGVLHVDPGLVTVRATSCDTGEVIARDRVWVRAGDVTAVDMTPRSREEQP